MSNLQATSSALEKAIQANLDIQAELIAKLRHIAQVKQNNRLQCTKIKSALERHLDSRIDEELGNKNNADETTEQTEGNVKSYMNKQWNDNDNLKWKRRYFVDPERSTPEPNADEIRRRTWEGDLASGDYVNRLVPWSKIETNALIECAEEVRKEQQQEEENDLQVKDADIDFHKVAARVEAKLSKKKFTPSQMARHTYSLPDGTTKNKHIPRSWVDYRIKFLCSASPSINKRPFTKAESLKIIELLHSYDGDPPWHLVAQTLGTSRTPFQCFQHAQIKLTNTLKETGNTAMLTKDEDELLFKFIAASGPQFVLNTYSTVMVQKMFPHANHNRIMLRAHMSLMNPQFANEKWSEREERMLALGMKVYDGCETAIGRAGALLGSRSTKLANDKWIRSLNPCYSTQPFTKAEERDFIKVVKKYKIGTYNWSAVAQKFPTRNPRWLQTRWLELGKMEDIARLKGDQLMNLRVRRLGRRTTRNKKSTENGSDDELSARDFAVRFSKKQRTSDDRLT